METLGQVLSPPQPAKLLCRCCTDSWFIHLPPSTVALRCPRHGPGQPVAYRRIEVARAAPVYVAMETGQIVSLRHPVKVLTTEAHPRSGHLRVSLWGPGRRCDRRRVRVAVHRLVCTAWHGPAPGPEALVLHGPNHDPRDNRPSNLRWGTLQENVTDREERRRRLQEMLHPELRRQREADAAVAFLERAGRVPAPSYEPDVVLGF